jgi:heme/copper-type cytochrome/quinol oxidase subunit 3
VDDLSFGEQLLFVALGVAASALIPVLVAAWPKPERSAADFWKVVRPYVALAVGSFVIAFIVLAILASQNKELKQWWQAALAGYAFDSTLQKFKEGLNARRR